VRGFVEVIVFQLLSAVVESNAFLVDALFDGAGPKEASIAFLLEEPKILLLGTPDAPDKVEFLSMAFRMDWGSSVKDLLLLLEEDLSIVDVFWKIRQIPVKGNWRSF